MHKIIIAVVLCAGLCLAGCQKKYYYDTGLSNPRFNMSMLQYLESNPFLFDTLVKVIKIAGLEDYFKDSSFTFFAPADSSIMNTYRYINSNLKLLGRDSLKGLESLKPEFWRSTLRLYMFPGVRGLEDFPQLDLSLKQALPGTFARSMGQRMMNIGAVFTDARGLKYKGQRYLTISYVPSESAPFDSWITNIVSTCNVRPNNGIVHVLMYPEHYLGFSAEQTWLQADYIGFNN